MERCRVALESCYTLHHSKYVRFAVLKISFISLTVYPANYHTADLLLCFEESAVCSFIQFHSKNGRSTTQKLQQVTRIKTDYDTNFIQVKSALNHTIKPHLYCY